MKTEVAQLHKKHPTFFSGSECSLSFSEGPATDLNVHYRAKTSPPLI
jgi:hypothetical protein